MGILATSGEAQQVKSSSANATTRQKFIGQQQVRFFNCFFDFL
jgi:hypothetical protein